MQRAIFGWIALSGTAVAFGLFCSTSATVQDLVSCSEAYQASRNEADLISDKEEAADVTIAYVRGSKPGATFR